MQTNPAERGKGGWMNVWELLRVHFPENAYTLLREVRNAAGYNATRSADGVAVGLWPSRGLEIEGLELKAHRQDWINELKNPAKAEQIFQFCDRWWIVAEKEGIVKQEEVPAPWGFMEVRGEKLFTVIKAPKLEPKPLTKGFVVCMLKRASSGMIPLSEIASKIAEAKKEGGLSSNYRIKYLEEEITNLKSGIAEFEKESGVHITRWNAGNIGKAVELINRHGVQNIKNEFLHLKDQADRISQNIAEIINH
jgi:hypothetical protein